ncbi:MAG: hypothetical protein KAI42_02675 [Dehalococcoidales bacterium]|nr:hypothetical protein [Dehalococcoidales bacterium]
MCRRKRAHDGVRGKRVAIGIDTGVRQRASGDSGRNENEESRSRQWPSNKNEGEHARRPMPVAMDDGVSSP